MSRPIVIRVIRDNDGEKPIKDVWHYGTTLCGDPAILCSGEYLICGVEEFEERIGRITCKKCRDIIKGHKEVDLR